MRELLARILVVLWPLIPLFWIPLRLKPSFFRRLGLFTYPLVGMVWLAIALGLWRLWPRIDKLYPVPLGLSYLGWLALIVGIILQAWTIQTLGLRILGLPEIAPRIKKGLVTDGPFRICRHPTYLAHSFIFFGGALATQYLALLIVAFLDLIVVQTIIIPAEEGELRKRFGPEFDSYRQKTPRFLPRLWP